MDEVGKSIKQHQSEVGIEGTEQNILAFPWANSSYLVVILFEKLCVRSRMLRFDTACVLKVETNGRLTTL